MVYLSKKRQRAYGRQENRKWLRSYILGRLAELGVSQEEILRVFREDLPVEVQLERISHARRVWRGACWPISREFAELIAGWAGLEQALKLSKSPHFGSLSEISENKEQET